jgi:hypothetical protein
MTNSKGGAPKWARLFLVFSLRRPRNHLPHWGIGFPLFRSGFVILVSSFGASRSDATLDISRGFA